MTSGKSAIEGNKSRGNRVGHNYKYKDRNKIKRGNSFKGEHILPINSYIKYIGRIMNAHVRKPIKSQHCTTIFDILVQYF